MNLAERQDEFCEIMNLLDNWVERFNFIIEQDTTPAECPASITAEYRLPNCRSNTRFRCVLSSLSCGEELGVKCEGWSNSPILSGLISVICNMVNGISAAELLKTDIYFHTRTKLVENITPLRREALEEIINRIKKAAKQSTA